MGRFLLRNLPLAAEPWACCLCPTCLQYPDLTFSDVWSTILPRECYHSVLCYPTTAELFESLQMLLISELITLIRSSRFEARRRCASIVRRELRVLYTVMGLGESVWRKLSVGMLDVFGEAMHCSTHPFQALLDSTCVFTNEDSTKHPSADKQRHKLAVSW